MSRLIKVQVLSKFSQFNYSKMKAIHVIGLFIALFWGFQNSTMAQTSSNHLNLELNDPRRLIQKKPRKPINFTPAIAIKPSSLLLDWLNNKINLESRKLVKIPVVIKFDDSYRLGIDDAFIGTSDADIDQNTIFFKLNDSAMGVSLLARLRYICPKTSDYCAVWLVGYWGSLFDSDAFDRSLSRENQQGVTKWAFDVREVHKLIEQSEQNRDIKVLIESP
ncbi:MAG TPA: hypothetical protein VK203_14670 [Nostocaceae cyanobacterium]|nr:hypothetical protein [Nostocaceae cyanobacterium]